MADIVAKVENRTTIKYRMREGARVAIADLNQSGAEAAAAEAMASKRRCRITIRSRSANSTRLIASMPERFRKSKSVGAVFGLTCCSKNQQARSIGAAEYHAAEMRSCG